MITMGNWKIEIYKDSQKRFSGLWEYKLYEKNGNDWKPHGSYPTLPMNRYERYTQALKYAVQQINQIRGWR